MKETAYDLFNGQSQKGNDNVVSSSIRIHSMH